MQQQTIQSLVLADVPREQIELWCRQRTQQYVVPHVGGSAIMSRVLGKYIMRTAALDEAITPHLALSGIWEPWITMAIARHLKPGMRCMDVGACYGYYALLMADIVGSGGSVVAWEPVWCDTVRFNASANGLSVEVVPHLMGTPTDQQFCFKFPSAPYNAGNIELKPALTAPPVARRIGVHAPDTKTWDFIKIDVEGSEGDVWEALAGVREVSPDLTVCMEFTPEKHTDPKAFLEKIQADGFKLGTCGHDGQPRPCSIDEALVPDTGAFRMLWLW